MAPSEQWSDPRRAHQRFTCRIYTVITLADHTGSGFTVDISLGGAKVQLPMAASIFDLRSLRSLRIEGIGHLKAKFIRSSNTEFAVSFDHTPTSRAQLSEYLEKFQ